MSYQYVKAPIGVFPILDGSDAKVLLIYLINTANYWKAQKGQDEFHISVSSLCSLMGISPNTLNKAIKQLEGIKVLQRNSAGYGNGKQTATYKINWNTLYYWDKATKEQKEDMRLKLSQLLASQNNSTPTPEITKGTETTYDINKEEDNFYNRKFYEDLDDWEKYKNSQSDEPEDDDYDDGTNLPF